MKRVLFSFILIVILMVSLFTVYANESGFVNCNLLNVRVSPNTDSEIVTQLAYGSKLEIVYADKGWYNVKMENGGTGFVFAPYISKAELVTPPAFQNQIATNIATDAHNYIGCRYVYGSSGPSSFDCSGFTSYLYKKYGVILPRTSTSQGAYGTYVSKNDLAAGDIVCFSNRSDRKINHVGIYIGSGNFIHASTSVRGVVMDNLDSAYYLNNYVTARRVL